MTERIDLTLSPAEIEAVQVLHRDAPYLIDGISRSIFSIARHYGGMKFQGHRYTYNPVTDECIRKDVLAFVAKMRKAKKAPPVVEPDLFGISL